MAEAGRLLKPGGRYVFTTDIVPDSPDPARRVLDEHVDAAGLELLRKEVVPRFAEQLQQMYDLWVEHVDEITAEVGEVVAKEMVEEAETVGPTLARRTPYLVTARRPSLDGGPTNMDKGRLRTTPRRARVRLSRNFVIQIARQCDTQTSGISEHCF